MGDMCVMGLCKGCAPAQGLCTTVADCCPSTTVTYTCQASICCVALNGICTSISDCCSDATTCSGTCQ
jgi:hypothetical protein